MNTLADNVKNQRQKLGLSQDQLGKKAGMSQPAIAKIERGGETKKIKQLAKALNMTVDQLLSDDNVDDKINLKKTDLHHRFYVQDRSLTDNLIADSLRPTMQQVLSFDNLGFWLNDNHPYVKDKLMKQTGNDVDFVVEMNDDSMEPEIIKGYLLRCRIDSNPIVGKFVIAETQLGNYIARQIYKDGDELKLKAYKNGYDWRTLTECKIIAHIVAIYKAL